MNDAVLVAIITGGISLLGNLIANSRTLAVIKEKIDQLEKKQDKHNNVIERQYKLEEKACVMEEQIKVANHRISDLERNR
ncbi:MAG: hypothetical protein KBT35_01195 [Firmicutes bacterium]|nr:hypothetical protein [Candidatus Colivicinus equi]